MGLSCVAAGPTYGATISAPAATDMQFDIPAGPLAEVLTRFGRQSGVQVSVNGDLARDATSGGVRGRMAPDVALGRLLAGTGLAARYAGPRNVLIHKASATITLGPIRVGGTVAREDPLGPGVGYGATTSTAGTKTDTSLIHVPQSIYVVTRRQIEDQKPQTLQQSLRYTAGVLAEQSGVSPTSNSDNGGILQRGFASVLFLDGLRTFGTNGNIDPALYDRIEAVEGPASVMYGQGNPGGIVNMVSKLPNGETIRQVEAGIGNYNRYQGSFDFGGRVDHAGIVEYRVAASAYSEDSQVRFQTQKRVAISPSIKWTIDAETSWTLLGNYTYQPSLGAYLYAPAQGSVLPNPHGVIPTSFFSGDPDANVQRNENGYFGYKFLHNFRGALSFSQNFRYQSGKTRMGQLYFTGISDDLRSLDRYYFLNVSRNQDVLLDNHLEWKRNFLSVRNDMLIGVDYQWYDYTYTGGFDFSVPPIDIFHPSYHVFTPPAVIATPFGTTSQTSQVGLYAQDQITYGHWHATLGARGDWTSQRSGGSGYDVSHPTWRAGILYAFDNGMAPYASYSTSFAPQGANGVTGQVYKPLTGEQYEVGIKYQSPLRKMFFSVAAYQVTERNVLVQTSTNALAGETQVGAERVRGVEIQGHATLARNLDAIGSYTYMDPAVTEGGETYPGKRMQSVPSNTASLWIDYMFAGSVLRGAGIGAGVRYTGSSWGDSASSLRVPGYVLGDAVFHYDFGRRMPSLGGLKLQFNVSNLADIRYVPSCISSFGCYYGPRRSAYATMKYSW